MESQLFDFVKIEKEKAIARFNFFRRIAKLRQFLEVFLVLGLISWSSARAPPLLRAAAAYAVQFSTYLFNHHVVFLIGNAIVFMLFLLCRHSDAAVSGAGDDLYDEYVKHSDAAADQRESTDLPPPAPSPTSTEAFNPSTKGSGEEKQIVVCAEATPPSDDMTAAIEEARKQIKRFERTQSEKLKREIRATRLRRSETLDRRNSVSFEAAEIERLSSEDFQRTIDAFIDEKWSTRKKKRNEFDEYQNYQLLKMAY